MDLRDFEGILIFFSEEEIDELQAAIDKRRIRRLALDEESSLNPVEQPDYSPKLAEKPSEKPHERANLLAIRRLIAT